MWPRWSVGEWWRSVMIAGAVVAGTTFFSANHVAAQSLPDGHPADVDVPIYGWRETWAGVDVAHDQWLFYSGLTVAPASRDIYSDGWRLRIGGGYGQYGYDGLAPRQPCGDATKNDRCTETDRPTQHYKVSRAYAELLLGYYLRLGALTAKAFAGASLSDERHLVVDPQNDDDGTYVGAKGVLELWLNLNEQTWTSLDLSYATARDETSARWRAGWRIEPQLSIGPELRYDKNIETADGEWNGRAGLFVRYEWTGGEVSLAGGWSGRIEDWKAPDMSPYGTLNVLFQF